MREHANFFWVGSALSLYEWVCISSFVKRGFQVRLWAYDRLMVPNGVELCDAEEILPEVDIKKYTQNGQRSNLAAFSDMFRYALQVKAKGWWFDADVFCLKGFEEFSISGRKVILGREDSEKINGGVMYFPDLEVAKLIYDSALRKCRDTNYDFEWGAIGPKLITRAITDLNLLHEISDIGEFYPYHYSETYRSLLPEHASSLEHRCAASKTFHLWNEILRRYAWPKNIMPPENSFLWRRFIEVDPCFRNLPSLPVDSAIRLIDSILRPPEYMGVREGWEIFKKTLSIYVRKHL